MEEKSGNTYYQVLKWGHKRTESGVTFQEYERFLIDLGCHWGDGRKVAIFHELFISIEMNPTPSKSTTLRRDGAKFHLRVESSFRHIERVELEEARKSSRSAVYWAAGSMVLGAIVGAVQIGLSVYGGLPDGL